MALCAIGRLLGSGATSAVIDLGEFFGFGVAQPKEEALFLKKRAPSFGNPPSKKSNAWLPHDNVIRLAFRWSRYVPAATKDLCKKLHLYFTALSGTGL